MHRLQNGQKLKNNLAIFLCQRKYVINLRSEKKFSTHVLVLNRLFLAQVFGHFQEADISPGTLFENTPFFLFSQVSSDFFLRFFIEHLKNVFVR